MDRTTSIVLVVVVVAFSLVAISAFVRYRGSSRVKITGPLSTGMEIQSDNPMPPGAGALIEDASSRAGGAEAMDETGRGATIRRVEVEGDLRASSSNPGTGAGPKA